MTAVRPGATAEAAVLAQLWLAAGLLEVALRRVPMTRVARRAGRAARSPAARWFPAGRAALRADRLDELASRASTAWRGAEDCLPRSVLRCWLAASDGRAATVVVGVRRAAGTGFAAHAWAVVDGRVQAERSDPTRDFQPIATYSFDARGGPDPSDRRYPMTTSPLGGQR